MNRQLTAKQLRELAVFHKKPGQQHVASNSPKRVSWIERKQKSSILGSSHITKSNANDQRLNAIQISQLNLIQLRQIARRISRGGGLLLAPADRLLTFENVCVLMRNADIAPVSWLTLHSPGNN